MPKYDNSGTLGRNRKKTKANQPDFNGRATVDGTEYWISAPRLLCPDFLTRED